MMHPKQLSEMISSRICHDLISPVGAVSNGVELMIGLNGPSAELELINQSADSAQAKLMFFRVAFGASGPDAMLGHSAASTVAKNMFDNRRVSVEFPEPWGDRSRQLVKLLYLLLLCVESSLPRGGVIRCIPTHSGWHITVKDTKIEAPSDLWHAVINRDPIGALNSNQIQFQLARDVAENAELTLSASFSETELSVLF